MCGCPQRSLHTKGQPRRILNNATYTIKLVVTTWLKKCCQILFKIKERLFKLFCNLGTHKLSFLKLQFTVLIGQFAEKMSVWSQFLAALTIKEFTNSDYLKNDFVVKEVFCFQSKISQKLSQWLKMFLTIIVIATGVAVLLQEIIAVLL